MKKVKLLPSILMLVMCIAVLGVGIYAVSPAQNNVSGTITVIASGAEITVSVYKDSVSQANLLASKSSRNGTTVPVNTHTIDASNASDVDDAPTVKLIVVFSTTSTDAFIVDTETIEYFDGIVSANSQVFDDVVMVSKVHTPGQTDVATGLASFTKDKDYQIACNFSVTELQDQSYDAAFNLKFFISKASEYVKQGFASARPTDKNSLVGINGVDYLYFGQYPQTRVIDQSILSTLTPTGEVFESALNEDGNAIFKDSAGNKYVKIDNIIFNIDENINSTGETGFFLIEDIKWNILSQENGQVFLMSNASLDAVRFCDYYRSATGKILKKDGTEQILNSYFMVDESGELVVDEKGYNVFANNYEYSALRKYLNGSFYNQAFTNYQKSKILKTTVINDGTSTQSADCPYVCNNTQDYVFALSYQELIKAEYGFESDPTVIDLNRIIKVSEYSLASGAEKYSEEEIWKLVNEYSGLPASKEGTIMLLMATGKFATQEKASDYYDEFISCLGYNILRSPVDDSAVRALHVGIGAFDGGWIRADYEGGSCLPAIKVVL